MTFCTGRDKDTNQPMISINRLYSKPVSQLEANPSRCALSKT